MIHVECGKEKKTKPRPAFANLPDGLDNCNSSWCTADRDAELRWIQESFLWKGKDDGTSAFEWEWIIVTFRAILGEPLGYRLVVLWEAGFCNPFLESSTAHCDT